MYLALLVITTDGIIILIMTESSSTGGILPPRTFNRIRCSERPYLVILNNSMFSIANTLTKTTNTSNVVLSAVIRILLHAVQLIVEC